MAILKPKQTDRQAGKTFMLLGIAGCKNKRRVSDKGVGPEDTVFNLPHSEKTRVIY
jgi:hypothetical protein